MPAASTPCALGGEVGRLISAEGIRSARRSLCGVDVRIGVTQAPREINLELDDGEREKTEAAVEAALSGAVVQFLTDPVRRREVTTHASASVNARFTMGAMLGRFQDLYDDVLARRGSASISQAGAA